MKLISSLITIIFFSLISLTANAATGCVSDITGYIYINPEGKYREGVPSYYHRWESDRISSVSAYCTVRPGGNCYIYATRDGYSSSPGKIIIYNDVSNCPLDTYTIALLVGFALVGFVFIKKNRIGLVV